MQDDGKYVRRFSAKPSGGLCAVLPKFASVFHELNFKHDILAAWDVLLVLHSALVEKQT